MTDKELLYKFKDDPYYPGSMLDMHEYFRRTNINFIYILIDQFLDLRPSDKAMIAYSDILVHSKPEIYDFLDSISTFCSNSTKVLIIKRMKRILECKGYSDVLDAYTRMVLEGDTSILVNYGKCKSIDYSIYKDNVAIYHLKEYLDYLIETSSKLTMPMLEELLEGYSSGRLDKELIDLYRMYDEVDQSTLRRICPSLYGTLNEDVKIHNTSNSSIKGINKLLELIKAEIKENKRHTSIRLIRMYESLPQSDIFYLYLTNHNQRCHYLYNGLSLKEYLDMPISYSMDNFSLYFNGELKYCINYDYEGRPLGIAYNYILRDKLNNTCLSVVFTNGYPNNLQYISMLEEGGRPEPKLLSTIIKYIEGLEETKSLKAKVKSEWKDIVDKYNKKIFLEAFSYVENKLRWDSTSRLLENSLVGVEYSFITKNDEYYLSFKVGIDKYYQVSNPNKLLKGFLRHEVIRYGKNLEFAHELTNLKEEDRAIIGFLAYLSLEVNKKYLRLGEELFAKLLGMLKGRSVMINDRMVSVRLDYVEPVIYMDSGYSLHLRDDYRELYCLNDRVLIIDIENNLDEVDRRLAPLVKLVLDFNEVSLEGVKSDFNDRMYSLYNENIELAPEISDDFKLDLIDINAYFDINKNNKITVRADFIKHDRVVDPNSLVSEADLARVRGFYDMLDLFGFNADGVMESDEDVLTFLRLDLGALKKTCNVYLSEVLEKNKLISFLPPRIRMNYNNDMLKVFLEESEYSEDELAAILRAIRGKKKYVLLKGDRIIALDNSEAIDFLRAVEDLSLDEGKLESEQEKPLYQSLVAFSHLARVELDDYIKGIVNDIKGFKDIIPALPNINADLRQYQKEGFSWLSILHKYKLGGILADDMGLGKTLEMITLLSADDTKMPTLIICPKSLIYNWISEFNRFTSDMELIPINGLSAKRDEIIANIDPNRRAYYITSYDSARIDADKYKAKFNNLILDEAQYIKNSLAITTQNIKRINGINRFALTGTPIENDIFDLWSIFDFLMPGYLPKISIFKSKQNDQDFQEMIKRRVAPFILRRTKEAVLNDLPPKYERIISADMTPEQRKLYDAHCLEAKEILGNGGKSFDVLHLLTRLRQICVDPRTFVDGISSPSGKLLMLNDIVAEYIENGHRILIFSQFVKALNLVEAELRAKGISYYMITGDTKGEERIRLVNSFNKNTEVKVFLISLKAGGTGLNLVGADTVIHLDPWWNLAAENQASDRAHRIGQRKNVEVIKLIVSNSIEEKVIELQARKKDLVDKLISNDTSLIERVTLDDLKFILD